MIRERRNAWREGNLDCKTDESQVEKREKRKNCKLSN